jgi:hypothetical protein
MVLDALLLEKDLGISTEDVATMKSTRTLYSFLDQKRRTLYGEKLVALSQAVNDTEKMHYRTLECMDAMLNGGHRRQVLKFLFEVNHFGSGGAFKGTGLKNQFTIK